MSAEQIQIDVRHGAPAHPSMRQHRVNAGRRSAASKSAASAVRQESAQTPRGTECRDALHQLLETLCAPSNPLSDKRCEHLRFCRDVGAAKCATGKASDAMVEHAHDKCADRKQIAPA